MLLRGLYYAEWDPSRVPVKMDRGQFLDRVRREFPYEVRGGVEALVPTVLRALKLYGSEGEWEDVKASLPKELSVLVP
jgi:uncharacterized protein (DUF2267 family)